MPPISPLHDSTKSADGRDPFGWCSEHPAFDFVIAAAVVGAHVAVVATTNHGDWLRWVPLTQRQATYASGAGVVTLLGTVAAIGLAIYHATTGERAKAVRGQYGDEMRRNWRAILVSTGLSGLICLAAIGANSTADVASTRFWFEFAIALWVVRYVRLVWLFGSVLGVRDMDFADKPRAEAPKLGEKWLKQSG
jgi:hypothetical protein